MGLSAAKTKIYIILIIVTLIILFGCAIQNNISYIQIKNAAGNNTSIVSIRLVNNSGIDYLMSIYDDPINYSDMEEFMIKPGIYSLEVDIIDSKKNYSYTVTSDLIEFELLGCRRFEVYLDKVEVVSCLN